MNKSSVIEIKTNEAILVSFAEAGSQTFTLNLGYVPDEIRVKAALYNDETDGKLYQVTSSLFPGSFLACCNDINTFNPTFSYSNNSRQSLTNTFSVNVIEASANAQLASGTLLLFFEYVRFR